MYGQLNKVSINFFLNTLRKNGFFIPCMVTQKAINLKEGVTSGQINKELKGI